MKTTKILSLLCILGIVFLFSCGKFKTTELKLIPVESDGKWGFIDEEGKYVVNPQFQSVSFFCEGMAAVENFDSKWGYINEKGEIVINPQYKSVCDFSEDLACVVKEGGMPQYINAKGELKFQIDADKAGSFHGSYAYVKIKDKCGYIDKTGIIKINAQFDNILPFSEELAPVCNFDVKDSIIDYSESKWGFINSEGKLIIAQQFKSVYGFTCSLAAATLDNKQWGFINKTGKFIINPQFDEVRSFFNDIAPFKQDNLWGFIDLKGKIIINPQFDMVLTGNSDMIPVKSSNKWGYIDYKGKYVINPQFEYATPFFGKIAIVKCSGKYGIIDKEGKYIVNPQFDNTVESSDYCKYLLYGGSLQTLKTDKIIPVDQVAEEFIIHIEKKEFSESKKLATIESVSSINMLEKFSEMNVSKNKEMKLESVKCIEDGDKATCDYVENGEAKKLDLVKKDNKWLVELKFKESSSPAY
jgi:hypothetical protein